MGAICLLISLVAAPATAGAPAGPRNVVLMIADGLGLNHLTAARLAFFGGRPEMSVDRMEATAFVLTGSADRAVTDSAAAATALASGLGTDNGCTGVLPDGTPVRSLLEISRDHGRSAGIVTTARVTDATPAAFYAHVAVRDFEEEIAAQLVEDPPELVLGGGRDRFGAHPFTGAPRPGSLLEAAVDQGIHYLRTRDELEELPGESPILGLFMPGHLSYAGERLPTEPTLVQMVRFALDRLAADPDGFFLVVEGAKVDKAAHAHLLQETLGEIREFDEAVGVVLDFAAGDGETLVVVTADHETGGLGVVGGGAGGEGLRVQWLTTDHTAGAVPLYAYGPGSEAFRGTLTHPDVARKTAGALGIEPFPQVGGDPEP
ncbi:alkaline phosphatase [Limnochorda pilosa]|uniref:Alkaline phosphatase n=1 Tax=Limnochorda pilosa TaxID=1555112 RepID=A0A0K2SI43_LIMPI|nr:alkaline phosphatase [Limnochorda pilosa]